MITVESEGIPPVVLLDGDNLKVTPVTGGWAAVRCDGPFVIITPATMEELRRLRRVESSFVEEVPPV